MLLFSKLGYGVLAVVSCTAKQINKDKYYSNQE